ncbi:MAG TPA: DUF2752 domain-containing protein [Pyrinomonadaceae bacterium]
MSHTRWPETSVASLLRHRGVALMVTAVAAAQVGAVAAGVGGWPCPFKGLTGLPCPGCGLTRAVVALARGEWRESLALHAFAPLLAAAVLAAAVAALLPQARREAFAAFLVRAERRVRLPYVLPAALLLYWSVRLLFLPGAFRP